MTATPSPSAAVEVRTVREVHETAVFPFVVHPEWQEEYPWLVQGITTRNGAFAFDMALFGMGGSGLTQERWAALRSYSGLDVVVCSRQLHGSRILHHRAVPPGLLVADSADGHITEEPGVLMAVSVADCVPVSLIDPIRRSAGLLHAGWRGIAAGILESGIAAMRQLSNGNVDAVRMHLGPAICGICYDVGPEVHHALGTGVVGGGPVDLRGVLAQRARALGIQSAHTSVSAYCTRCNGGFHSHRGGARERQVAVLGIRHLDAG